MKTPPSFHYGMLRTKRLPLLSLTNAKKSAS